MSSQDQMQVKAKIKTSEEEREGERSMKGHNLTLNNGRVTRTVEIGSEGTPILGELTNSETGYNWALIGGGCDFNIGFAHQTPHRTEGWRLSNSTWNKLDNGATQLVLRLEHESGIRVTQTSTCFPDHAVIEHQCTVSNEGSDVITGLISFNPLHFPIAPSSELQAYTVRRDQYALQSQPLKESLLVKGGNWNGPEHAGWMVLENKEAKELLYVGIEWEREWELAVNQIKGGYEISAGVVRYSRDLAPGDVVESPRIFMGLAHGSLDDAVQQMQDYLSTYVMPTPLPNFPWVTYDIWSTDNENVEEILLKELDFAADTGIELFYIDASWYAGSSIIGKGSWGLGLGNYEEDRRKFKKGLSYLSDRVHEKGLKFGIWTDPIVIDEQWVKSGLIPEHWLISEDGIHRSLSIEDGDWPTTLHLCTGCPEVVEHLYGKLSGIIEKYKLDWLKWDDSALNNPYCNRTDHGHQAGDGNFSALKGKYEICSRLMAKFPNLVIEQCGYPARLDYGLSRYTRANWLSDSTNNSAYVRSNLQVTGHVFPASYNTSFLVHDKEILEESNPEKLDTIVRSRLMGLIGLATLHGMLFERASLWPQPILEAFRRNIKEYKTYRHLLSQHAYHLTSPSLEPGDWHLHSFVSRDSYEAVVFCFRGESVNSSCRVKIKGLIKGKLYKIRSLNTGIQASVQGSILMDQGLAVELANVEMSDIFVLS